MKFSSALKRYNLSSQENTWRKLKCILPSERSQYEQTTHCLIPTRWHSGKGKTMETGKNWAVVVRGWGGSWVEVMNGRTQDFYETETILIDTMMVYMCHYTFIQTHRMYLQEWSWIWTVDFRWLRCVDVAPLIVIHGPLWLRDVGQGEAVHVWGQEDSMRNLCTYLSILLWTKKFPENITS